MKRVLVVDDSAIAREVLRDHIEHDGDLRVVGTAADLASAVTSVASLRPDVVTMDIQMPGGDGLAAIERIMARHPVPIVVVSAQARSDQSLPFAAVTRGALEVAIKPVVPADAVALRAALRRVAGIPVVPHVRPRRAARSAPAPRAAARSASAPASSAAPSGLPAAATTASAPRRAGPCIVGIAASAGGPAALDVVLGALPADLPACVALVQHLPAGFVEAFATYLRSRTALEIVLLGPGESVEARAGQLVLAGPDHHLVARSPRVLAAIPDPPLRGHRPSATLLFDSLARFVGERAIGVILTGIGDDGATGLADLRSRGGFTLGQDQKTSAVYGMPQAAFKLGAIARVVPLHDMAAAIRKAIADGGTPDRG